MTGLFVTGTDTEIGKTVVTTALLRALARRGMRTLGMKPVAAGCRVTGAGLRNDDALELMAAATETAPYEQINPVALEPAIAPHVAAEAIGTIIDVPDLAVQARHLEALADILVVEGVGGWRVPLGPASGLADLARLLRYPVVLVVGIRLGCISHALLTAEAIDGDGLDCAGWVANCPEPGVDRVDEQVMALRERLRAPCLGVIPHTPGASADALGGHLDVAPLRFRRP